MVGVAGSVDPLFGISSLESAVTLNTGPKRGMSTISPFRSSAIKLFILAGSTYAVMVTSRITEPVRASSRKSEWETPSISAILLFAAAVSLGVHASMDASITRRSLCGAAGVPVSAIGVGSTASLEGVMLGVDSMLDCASDGTAVASDGKPVASDGTAVASDGMAVASDGMGVNRVPDGASVGLSIVGDKVDGMPDGASDGLVVLLEEVNSTAVNGILDGSSDGLVFVSEGMRVDGLPDGASDGFSDGASDGLSVVGEGVDGAAVDGMLDGASDGLAVNGMPEGASDGLSVMGEGVDGAAVDGMPEGASDGLTVAFEGIAVVGVEVVGEAVVSSSGKFDGAPLGLDVVRVVGPSVVGMAVVGVRVVGVEVLR